MPGIYRMFYVGLGLWFSSPSIYIPWFSPGMVLCIRPSDATIFRTFEYLKVSLTVSGKVPWKSRKFTYLITANLILTIDHDAIKSLIFIRFYILSVKLN